MGVACGFMLGLVVVFMFAPRHSSARINKGAHWSKSTPLIMDPLDGELPVTDHLEVRVKNCVFKTAV